MGQEKQAAAKGLESLRKATDTLSTMLAQEVKDLNARQRAARRENSTDPGIMKGLKEATAVLKDLAGVSKTLNNQGVDAEGRECGVVLSDLNSHNGTYVNGIKIPAEHLLHVGDTHLQEKTPVRLKCLWSL